MAYRRDPECGPDRTAAENEDETPPCDDCGEPGEVHVIRVCLSCRPDLCSLCIGLGEVHYSSIDFGRCPQCGGSGRTDVKVTYDDDPEPDDPEPEHRLAAAQAVVDAAVAETEYEQMHGEPSEDFRRARLLAVARLWNADHTPDMPALQSSETATTSLANDGPVTGSDHEPASLTGYPLERGGGSAPV
jgi:hypothetical protein